MNFKKHSLALVASVGLALSAANVQAASLVYDSFLGDVFSGNILVNSITAKCELVGASYTPNKATHTKRSDVTNEVSGTGYTSGGTPCTIAGTLDTTNHRYDITITGPSWANSTITARGMVVYKYTGTASTDNLIAYIDFLADVTSTNSTFQTTVSSPIRWQN